MLGRDRARLEAIAGRVRDGVSGDRVDARLIDSDGFLGSGSAPARPVPGVSVSVAVDGSARDLAERLREGCPRVYTRIEDDRVLHDARTLFEDEIEPLIEALNRAVGRVTGRSEP